MTLQELIDKRKGKEYTDSTIESINRETTRIVTDKITGKKEFKYYGKNDYVKEIDCRVPYIGGGLFEYYEGYDWKKETLGIPNSFFSNDEQIGILDTFLYSASGDERLG